MTSALPDSSSIATSDPFRGRAVPWSREAEQAVLGAMLIDTDAALRGSELLADTVFHLEAHRRVFRALRNLITQHMAIDYVTVRDELTRRNDLEAVGGVEYLEELSTSVATAANLEYHARILRDKATQRQLIEAATQIITETYDARTNAGEMVDTAEARIFAIAQQRHDTGFVRIKGGVFSAMEAIDHRQKNHAMITGVPSGFTDLDELTSGFQKSELVIVAARPSMGKTAFCLNVAVNAAHAEYGVAIFSLEMSHDALVQRMLCAEAMVDSLAVRRGMLNQDQMTGLARGAGLLQNLSIWIDDTPALTLLEMRSKARRLCADNDVRLVVVDYLQLMRSPEYADNRVQEISDISRSLKHLARELNLPVIALSQLSRAPEQRGGDRTPVLSDLRDSGAIEQDADLVLFIHRPEMYRDLREKAEAKGESLDGRAELMLAKQRNGPTGSVALHYHKQFTRFDNRTERTE